jgi:hypothetical protein
MKILNFIAALAVFVLSGGCSENQNTIKLADAELKNNAEQNVSVAIPKTSGVAWRLRFSPSAYDFQKPPSEAKSQVEVFLKNTASSPLELALTEGKTPITLPPGASEKIFDGSIEALFLTGRSMHADFEILSSGPTQMELRFVPSNGLTKEFLFEVFAVRYREGL